MKKMVSKWKVVSCVVAILSVASVLLWTYMPKFLQHTIEGLIIESGAKLGSVTVEKLNPWAMKLSDLNVLSEEGSLSIRQLDARYDPVVLSNGKLHALSLTSPFLQVDIDKTLHRLNNNEEKGEDKKTFKQQADEFLSNPSLQHFRLRDSSISLGSGNKTTNIKLSMEGDFHRGLAQLRIDGNLSGLDWLGDLTMVQEGTDLFLGGALQFPDISVMPDVLSTIAAMLDNDKELDLNEWLKIEQGVAKGQWTGRVEQDGVMDQFMDFNVSNLIVQCMGLTLDVPQAILFVTPQSSTWVESNFYANLNWGKNLNVRGLKITANFKEGKLSLSARIQRMRMQGVLPNAEIVGLVIEDVDFAFDDEGGFVGLSQAKLRFSALHLEEGLSNLYDGELFVEWLGEDRFLIKLLKANASLPTIGLNIHNLGYEGEVALDTLPKLEKEQTLSIEEAFLGEDQKIENLKVEFNLDSMERIEISSLHMQANEIEFSFDPANLVVEITDPTEGGLHISVMEGGLSFADYKDFAIKEIIGSVKLNTLDPLESNGTQSIRFDLHAGEQTLQDGEIRFDLLSTGEKIIQTVELHAFGGLIALDETKVGENLDNLELCAVAQGLNSQSLISLFEDLDAQMEGNLSGTLSIRNDPLRGWDFYGGALSLDSSDSAKLYLNTKGMLTDGLDKKSSEYKNMYLLDRALQNLNLEALNILFKVKEDGDRVVEMNVRGESEVDGKDISVEYRPKIVGGLDALIQQADLTKWGVIP